MKSRSMILAVGLVAMVAAAITAADVKLDDVKCIMNPKAAAKAATGVEFKEGKVFFCCNNCASKFKGDKEKFATKANHQLVATGQYTQGKCPLSGGKLNAKQTVKVGGVNVQFCCGNCKGKVAGAKGDAQAEIVFGDKAFEKGFAVAKDK